MKRQKYDKNMNETLMSKTKYDDAPTEQQVDQGYDKSLRYAVFCLQHSCNKIDEDSKMLKPA